MSYELEFDDFEYESSKSIYKDSDLFYKYLREISKYSLLTKEEEQILFKECKKGNINARNKLIESNLRLVVWVARKFTNSNDYIMDLIQEGNKGLIKAIDKFDVDLGYKFSTYATWSIKKILLIYRNNNDNALQNPEYMKLIIKEYEEYIKKYNEKFGKNPTIEECCKYLNIKEYYLMNILSSSKKAVSLDAPAFPTFNLEEALPLVEYIEDETENHEEEIVDKMYINEIMQTIMSYENITEQELFVILARNGILKDGLGANSPKTLKEVSELLSLKYGTKELTCERIRQIEEKTYKKLKRKLNKTI